MNENNELKCRCYSIPVEEAKLDRLPLRFENESDAPHAPVEEGGLGRLSLRVEKESEVLCIPLQEPELGRCSL